MSLEQLAKTLRTHVEALAGAPRPPGTAEHRQAAVYVADHLRRAGFNVQAQVYKTLDSCTNLLTDPLPADPSLPLVVIGAHYDSVPGSPGADDNGSAVAALLELATWIRPQLDGPGPWHARLQLVSYDQEEYGLVGSGRHADEIQKSGQALRGMISLEMLGYTDGRPGSQQLPPMVRGLYPDVGNFIGVVGNELSAGLLRVVTGAMKGVPGLPVEYLAVPGNGLVLPETRLSDHSSFWDAGLPALMLTDTSFLRNPHYHRASDTPDTLDYDFLARVTQGVCAAALQLLRLERMP
ncbi:MAG: M28 family peptidase [Gemmataceae bacterium]|nr:M28 family peptidase [Gemmataceae bacterium]